MVALIFAQILQSLEFYFVVAAHKEHTATC